MSIFDHPSLYWCCWDSPFEELIAKYQKEGLTFEEAKTKAGETMNWKEDGEE